MLPRKWVIGLIDKTYAKIESDKKESRADGNGRVARDGDAIARIDSLGAENGQTRN
jgi:hypothetical protein